MKNISILLGLTLISACASNNLVQVEGVKRVSIHQDDYAAPQFYVKNYIPKKIKRSIASAADNEFTRLNVKKVYFLSLWQQQQTFSKILKKESQTFCPQFHNDLLKYESNVKGMTSSYDYKQNFKAIKDDPKNVVYYPVMSLPYKGADLYSYISKKSKWDDADLHVKKAIENHFHKNEAELQTLCLTGTSDGLYVFQNLATYYSDDKTFMYSDKSLVSILKVSTISNMLLLNSFAKSEFQATWTPVQVAVLQKLNVEWFKNYLYELTSMRNNTFSSYALKE